MKVRKIKIFSGEEFEVPQGIQRIDHRATHGWQLRYGGTKLFSDHTPDGSGAAASLQRATHLVVLQERGIAALPHKLRSKAQRAAAVPRFVAEVMPHFADGRIRPQIDQVVENDAARRTGQYEDAIRQRHRLIEVVRDQDDGLAHLSPDADALP